ncbi:MAG: hypothetical protein ACKO41_02255, partial [Sphingomonadales bacterium]
MQATSLNGFGYSLTRGDTIPKSKPSATTVQPMERTPSPDTLANSILDTVQRITTDTFRFKKSKDTLDAPIKYEAADSAVVLVGQKKVILYGKTNTVYSDMTLMAPKVELNQQTQIVTAVRSLDSTGATLDAAVLKTGETEMTNDT